MSIKTWVQGQLLYTNLIHYFWDWCCHQVKK
jgi:hypothetical protein